MDNDFNFLKELRKFNSKPTKKNALPTTAFSDII